MEGSEHKRSIEGVLKAVVLTSPVAHVWVGLRSRVCLAQQGILSRCFAVLANECNEGLQAAFLYVVQICDM